MSSSDIRDILQIGQRTEPPQQRKPKQPTEKRPEKYNREVFSLTGAVAPDAFVPPTYKAKFNVRKKPTPWVLQTFRNPIRNDDLELQHWIQKSEANKAGYSFAREEKKPDFLQYTEEEYAEDLEDPAWTKEETDYLMELCAQYDLRFFVIADRYEFDPRHHRSIDDLKERFYNIQQTLYHKAVGASTPFTFDKAKERERKHALGSLYSRKKEQQQEETELLAHVKRIEQNKAKLARERENLQEMLRQHEVAMIPINKKQTAKDKKRKRKSSGEAHDEGSPESTEKLAPGVMVRSQKLPLLKSSVQEKVAKVLTELSIGTRPVMPTASVCDNFEKLENSILTLYELKKVVDKMEIEHRITKGDNV